MADDDPASVTPKYLIGVVTKLTGLSVDVIRVWERRYGAVRPVRSAGGTRLYSDADILRLNRLHRAVEMGYGIGAAARLSESELDELIVGVQLFTQLSDPHQSARQRFIVAIQTLDVIAADQELTRAATLFPPGELVKKIVVPIVDDLSRRIAVNEFGEAHKRVATGLLRRMLESLIRLYPPPGDLNTVILATPAGEAHDFDLLLAALLAAVQGWRVVYLGIGVPAAEIALTIRLTGARVLALNIATADYGIDQELERISGVVSGSTQVWITGSGAVRQRAHIGRSNWSMLLNLEELDDRLKQR